MQRDPVIRRRHPVPSGQYTVGAVVAEIAVELTQSCTSLIVQEVDDYDDWWADQLSVSGYDSVYSRAPTVDCGLVTAFRQDKFQVFRTSEINLNDMCHRINDANLVARARQDNMALLVCLQPWESYHLPSAVCVANTQLAAGPSLETVRVLQAEYLCREIGAFNADFHIPIIFAGTFNSVPSSDVYHVVITGRRRPSPQAPPPPPRPQAVKPTLSSLTVQWEPPADNSTPESPSSPVLEFKISIKNCTSASIGFAHEVVVAAPASETVITTLSAGITYQFRVAARNANGWGHWSHPSAPIETLRTAATSPSKKARASVTAPLYIAQDTPPQVKPYNPSYGSGRTPRFEDKMRSNNLEVCPRPQLTAQGRSTLSSREEDSAGLRYATLQPRADRDDQLVHGDLMDSAYGEYFEYLCEPELTFSSDKFQGTVDYIFYSKGQLAPFQLLHLPTLEELEAEGQDVRQPLVVEDAEWVKHRPPDWKDTLVVSSDEEKYMGEWRTLELPNVVARASSWLPNKSCPSDHLPLCCVFAMRVENVATVWN